MRPAKRSVLLLGDYRYTLGFVRSLARRGFNTIVGDASPGDFASHSRFTNETALFPPDDSATVGGAWGAFLEHRLDVCAVLPMGDRQAVRLADSVCVLPPHAVAVTACKETVHLCVDKLRMCAVASELGVPQARFVGAERPSDVVRAADSVGFPCVVKPAMPLHSSFPGKALIARSRADLESFSERYAEDTGPFVVQQLARGSRLNVQLLAHRGTLVERLVTRTLRTDRPDGTGYTVESLTVRPSERLDRLTAALVGRLGYSGLACLQFLGSLESDELSFLEINPRLGAAFGVAFQCGVDFPWLAVSMALDGPPSKVRLAAYPPGKRMVWTGGDIDGIRRSLSAGEIGRWEAARGLGRAALGIVRADAHTTWSITDPWPSLRYYGRRTIRRLRRKLRSTAEASGGR